MVSVTLVEVWMMFAFGLALGGGGVNWAGWKTSYLVDHLSVFS